VKEVLGTTIIIPDKPGKQRTPYQKQKLRNGFKRRAAIEPYRFAEVHLYFPLVAG
jgi:IS5 family transposase